MSEDISISQMVSISAHNCVCQYPKSCILSSETLVLETNGFHIRG